MHLYREGQRGEQPKDWEREGEGEGEIKNTSQSLRSFCCLVSDLIKEHRAGEITPVPHTPAPYTAHNLSTGPQKHLCLDTQWPDTQHHTSHCTALWLCDSENLFIATEKNITTILILLIIIIISASSASSALCNGKDANISTDLFSHTISQGQQLKHSLS